MDNDKAIEEYETQLLSVEQTIQTLGADQIEELSSLESLKADLLELLELTKQTKSALEKKTNREDDDGDDDKDEIESEMRRFMSEISEIEDNRSTTKQENETALELKLKELKESLEEMVGQKCSAPHQHSWGAIAYHNAIICGVQDDVEVASDGTMDARLRILFTNPTHREMLPCAYFLEGECRFDDEHCHYSHGELIAPAQLREYTAPDFERLARNCIVLAKLDDRIWHRGRVLCVNFIEKICHVRLEGKEHKERDKDFAFENLLPIYHDDELSSGSSTDTDEDDAEAMDEVELARQARLVEQSLFTFKPTQPLGDWEKYTRGIGSKLMARMGYIHGTGLGSDGRGIVTPIAAQILPQGCSLDHCMALREAANGDKNLFSVERKLKRQQQKQLALNVKAYKRESQRIDVFSYLNENIFSNKKPSEESSSSSNRKCSFQDHTTKSLNVESVRIGDDIRRKEREIAKMQESLQRNTSDTEVHKRLQQQLSTKKQELNALRNAEKSLTKEQATRKTKDKLCVF